MKLKGLDRRLAALESKAKPSNLRLLWYNEEQTPPEPGAIRIKLKWLDEVRP
jgi:hypothetical protein